MLSQSTIDVVKSTAPLLEVHAESLTQLFYQRLFENNPEVKPFFNPAHQVNGRQQRALAGAIVAYASHIDELGALGPAVELITHKHASLGVKPEHYPIVGRNLLAAIEELLGDAATDSILDAWAEAYNFLANILIDREATLYQEHESQHGWQGFRRFRVTAKCLESDEITSFSLEPDDDGEIGKHKPGQYLTVRLPSTDPEHAKTTMRNYSISNIPNGQCYRISIKRERSATYGIPHGRVSGALHDDIDIGDVIEVGPPSGTFVLDVLDQTDRPLVLLSGGVGITPLLSMLHAAVESEIERDIYFVHAARNGKVHAFADEITELATRHPRLHLHVCYDEPTDEDDRETRFDSRGRIDLPLLQRLIATPDSDFYFCGPLPFMQAVSQLLRRWGVSENRIHYECFGPLQSLDQSAQIEKTNHADVQPLAGQANG